jgi:hypothetical protein
LAYPEIDENLHHVDDWLHSWLLLGQQATFEPFRVHYAKPHPPSGMVFLVVHRQQRFQWLLYTED